MVKYAVQVGWEVCSVGRYIGVSSADSVVSSSGGVDVDVQLRVVGVGKVSAVEVCLDVSILICWTREVVGEASR